MYFYFFYKFLEKNKHWTMKIKFNTPMSSVHNSVYGPNYHENEDSTVHK